MSLLSNSTPIPGIRYQYPGSGTPIYVGVWADRPDPATSGAGARILVTDVGGRSWWYSDGTYWRNEGPLTLLTNGSAATTSTGTTETVLATIPVKGLLLANSGKVIVEAIASYTNSANAKSLRLRVGGTGINGTVMWIQDLTTTQKNICRVGFQNRNATGAQVQRGCEFVGSGLGSTNAALLTSTVDTTADFNVYFTGQCANAADLITLQSIDAVLS